MKKEKIYLVIIIILFILCIGQFTINKYGSPLYRFIEIPDDKVCIKWHKPIPLTDGSGSWRYCLKAIDYTEDFNHACYWDYNCSIYSNWRGEHLGTPPSCLFMNINYSYWGNSTTSRFYNP